MEPHGKARGHAAALRLSGFVRAAAANGKSVAARIHAGAVKAENKEGGSKEPAPLSEDLSGSSGLGAAFALFALRVAA